MSTKSKSLPDIKTLFKDSWEAYKPKAGKLALLELAIVGITLGALIIFMLIMGGTISALMAGGDFNAASLLSPLVGGFGIFGIVFFMVAMFLVEALESLSLTDMALEKDAGVSKSLKKAWSLIIPGFVLIVLSSLILAGGFMLFVIPGIIISVHLSFMLVVLIAEKKKGFEALAASRSLVLGHWWEIFGRFLVLGLIIIAASIIASFPAFLFEGESAILVQLGIDLITNIIAVFFIAPFTAVYLVELYKQLVAVKGKSDIKDLSSVKKKYIGAIVGGIIAMMAFGSVIYYSIGTFLGSSLYDAGTYDPAVSERFFGDLEDFDFEDFDLEEYEN